MEQIYKGYAAFDAMTKTDFFFRTDAKKRSAGMFKAAAEQPQRVGCEGLGGDFCDGECRGPEEDGGHGKQCGSGR